MEDSQYIVATNYYNNYYVFIISALIYFNLFTENPYRQLPCNCHGSMPGKTAIELGPLWYVPKHNNIFRINLYQFQC